MRTRKKNEINDNTGAISKCALAKGQSQTNGLANTQ